MNSELAEYVICFDRDLTVDVNPPDESEAVPLAWVKELAHGEKYDHIDVWATGNQHLRDEAWIPGIEEARELFEAYRFDDAEIVYPSEGYHSYKPSRVEGLRLIYDVYEAQAYRTIGDVDDYTDRRANVPWFIVVDDADLYGVQDFYHYYPEGFVSAVRMGDTEFNFAPSGWCQEPALSNACQCDLERHCSIATFDD